MTDKPKLELITWKDLEEASEHRTYLFGADHINALISERLEVGYTKLKEEKDTWNYISPNKFTSDTHRIYYITQPLEEEKVECDLDHKTMLWISKEEYGPSNMHTCHKCGKKLTE